MIRRRFWDSVWLFCCLLAKAESKAVDTDSSCITFEFPEDDLKAQRKIMPRLDSFLERNQDKGPQTLRDEDDLTAQRKIMARLDSFLERNQDKGPQTLRDEDDLTAQRKIMARLDSFLERNQDKGPQTLRDEDDLTAQRKIMARLDSFLERNQDKGPQTLRDVLAVAGKEEKDLDMKIGKEEPLEAVLLRYLIFLHQDVRTLLEVKAPLIRYLKKNTDLKLSEKSSVSPFIGKRNIFTPTDSTVRPMDCSELPAYNGRAKSGVYEIYPYSSTCQRCRPVKVFCDMETDGGGWTVFLSRAKVSKPVNFSRNWNDYKTGFGTPGEEHWLGNEHLHTLTSTQNYVLRVEAQDGSGRESWGEWNTFSVDSESKLYKLTAEDPSPNNIAHDKWFTYNTGGNFSTFDRDNDEYRTVNCAVDRKGGWWYRACTLINPTGLHDNKDDKGIKFYLWSKQDAVNGFATHVQLKIRPKIPTTATSTS